MKRRKRDTSIAALGEHLQEQKEIKALLGSVLACVEAFDEDALKKVEAAIAARRGAILAGDHGPSPSTYTPVRSVLYAGAPLAISRRRSSFEYIQAHAVTTDESIFVIPDDKGNVVLQYSSTTLLPQFRYAFISSPYQISQSDGHVFVTTHDLETDAWYAGTLHAQTRMPYAVFFGRLNVGRVTVGGTTEQSWIIDRDGVQESYPGHILLAGNRVLIRGADNTFRFADMPGADAIKDTDVTCANDHVFYRDGGNLVATRGSSEMRCPWPMGINGFRDRFFPEKHGSFLFVSYKSPVRLLRVCTPWAIHAHTLPVLPRALAHIVDEYACGVDKICSLPGFRWDNWPWVTVAGTNVWLEWKMFDPEKGRTMCMDLTRVAIILDQFACLRIRGFDSQGRPVCAGRL